MRGSSGGEKALSDARGEGWREKLKWGLTLKAAADRGAERPNWGRPGAGNSLDGAPSTTHCAAEMYGLETIGGICRIIIR
jgi:hypothetical protein